MSKRVLNLYLAGNMEKSLASGITWRAAFTAWIEAKDFSVKVWNPIEFEKEQLSGLCPGRLPDEMPVRKSSRVPKDRIIRTDEEGIRYIKPVHWHEFKWHKRYTGVYNRGRKYMNRCQKYDLKLIREIIDYLIVNWTPATKGGGGTYGEIEEAVKKGIPVYMVESAEIPAWIEWHPGVVVFETFAELYTFLEEELGN